MTGAELGDALADMWRSVLLFVPTALAFLVILLIGYVLARLFRTIVAKGLRGVGFDRAVERSGLGRALRGGDVEASDLCAKIAFYAVMLFALQLAFGIWGPNAVSDMLTAVVAWMPRAFVAIVIVVVAAAVAHAVRDLITGALGGLPYGALLGRTASVLILGLGVIAALDQVGIATAVTRPVLIAVLATVAGVVIVGVGGGLVRPMQQRWEGWLARAGAESQVIRDHARSYVDARAAEAAAEAQAAEQARVAAQAQAEAEAQAAAQAQAEAEAEVAAQARSAAGSSARAGAVDLAVDDTQVIPVQPASIVPGFDDAPAPHAPAPHAPAPHAPAPHAPALHAPAPDAPAPHAPAPHAPGPRPPAPRMPAPAETIVDDTIAVDTTTTDDTTPVDTIAVDTAPVATTPDATSTDATSTDATSTDATSTDATAADISADDTAAVDTAAGEAAAIDTQAGPAEETQVIDRRHRDERI
jgi:hypothetical protein